MLIDEVDRQILAELEENGRLTVTELAARINLSVSPCHRRLRELERTGAIRGYRAIVDPVAVGLGFQALVLIVRMPPQAFASGFASSMSTMRFHVAASIRLAMLEPGVGCAAPVSKAP